MATTFESSLLHFRNTNRRAIISAGEALSKGDFAAFGTEVDRIAGMELTTSIATMINSSRATMREFLVKIEEEFGANAIKFVLGGVLAGVGGCALAEAAGLAILLGVTILTVEIIAIGMILLGLCICLPAVWSLTMKKLGEHMEEMGAE